MNEVAASHILVGSEDEAKNLITELEGGSAFETLAQSHSQCPSGQQGGDLGSFGRGAMVAEFETAAFELEVGSVSGPVQTQFGFHIIKRTA